MKYYLDRHTDQNGLHMLHRADCPYRPDRGALIVLGDYPDCHGALKKAMEICDSAADNCPHCSGASHIGPADIQLPQDIIHLD